jgi:hypothetical protein
VPPARFFNSTLDSTVFFQEVSPLKCDDRTPSAMTFSYLVSTAGHAQHQNDLNPHEIRNILQIIEDGAKEFGEEKVVGFASVSGPDGCWSCDRHCGWDIILHETLADRVEISFH